MKEVSFIFDIHPPNSGVFWKFFEDKQSCFAIAELKKIHREKNIAVKYYHFQRFVQNKLFRYVSLIQENKHQTFLLSHLTKHY